MKIEIATLQMTIKVKDGVIQSGTPHLEIVQNNHDEVIHLVPDGEYKWTLVLDPEQAEKHPLE